MILGRVAGTVHSTIRHPFFASRTLLVVARTGADGVPTSGYVVAVDSVGAGVGQRVLVLDEGNGARQVLGSPSGPVRSVVVAIIDRVDQD